MSSTDNKTVTRASKPKVLDVAFGNVKIEHLLCGQDTAHVPPSQLARVIKEMIARMIYKADRLALSPHSNSEGQLFKDITYSDYRAKYLPLKQQRTRSDATEDKKNTSCTKADSKEKSAAQRGPFTFSGSVRIIEYIIERIVNEGLSISPDADGSANVEHIINSLRSKYGVNSLLVSIYENDIEGDGITLIGDCMIRYFDEKFQDVQYHIIKKFTLKKLSDYLTLAADRLAVQFWYSKKSGTIGKTQLLQALYLEFKGTNHSEYKVRWNMIAYAEITEDHKRKADKKKREEKKQVNDSSATVEHGKDIVEDSPNKQEAATQTKSKPKPSKPKPKQTNTTRNGRTGSGNNEPIVNRTVSSKKPVITDVIDEDEVDNMIGDDIEYEDGDEHNEDN